MAYGTNNGRLNVSRCNRREAYSMNMKSYFVPALWACIVVIPAAVAAQNTVTPGPQASRSWTDGHPIETRPPEKSDDKPAFPEQTRAPYHASAPFHITTLIDNL